MGDPPPWDAPPPSPPARRHGAGEAERGFDDDLDFDESRRRRWPLALLAVLLIVAVGGGGYLAYDTWIASDDSTPPETGPTAEPEPEPEPEPESTQAEQLIAALESREVDCFETLTDPAPTFTCYGIVSVSDNASSSMTLRFQHDGDGTITVARLDASVSPNDREGSVDVFTELAQTVADEVIGGGNGEGTPTLNPGEEENVDVPWGTVRTDISEYAVAVFTRDGAEPQPSNSQPLQPGVGELVRHLQEQGFSCESRRCELQEGNGPEAATLVTVVDDRAVRMNVELGDQADALPEEEVVGMMHGVIDQVFPNRADEARAWFDEHREAQLQRADFDAVRIDLNWGNGEEPAMSLSSASAWPYE